MADDIAVTPGSGATIAADDVGGKLHQRVKLSLGADGAAADALGGTGVDAAGVQRVTLATDVPLPAGTNAIGKLAANSGVDIGDVDVTSVIPGTGATALGKAVDSAAGATDTGVAVLQVRDDALASLTPIDGDYTPLRGNARGAQWVAIEDGAGGQITSFGGGTQYTEGDTDASITGTALMWEDAADTLVAASAANPLPVEIIAGAGSGGTAIADDAAFTVGTTSLTPVGGTYRSTRDSVDDGDAGAFAMTPKRGLYAALETPNGDSAMDDTNDAVKVVNATAGNLNMTEASGAAIKAAVEIMDDWDESDRAKVNLIVGQAGIAAGAGAVGATVPRVTLASDDPGVALLTTIDADTSALAGAVSGTEVQVDVVAALPAGTNTIGKVEHTSTGIGHGVKTVSSAGTDEALAGSTAAKWVTIQAQTDNTGYVAVGASGVDATVATGTGVLLAAGESITLPVDNLADVFVDATVNGEGVRYTYGT